MQLVPILCQKSEKCNEKVSEKIDEKSMGHSM